MTDYDQYWQSHIGSSRLKADTVLPLLDLHDGYRAVEVGCGDGTFLGRLREYLPKSCRLTGYDISAVALCRAAEEWNGIDWLLGSAQEVPPGWDAIFVMDVLEHVEDPAGFLLALKGKSDRIYLRVPMEVSFAHLLTRRPGKSYAADKHLWFWSRDSLRTLLGHLGFTILREQYEASLFCNIQGKHKAWQALRWLLYQRFPFLGSVLLGGHVTFVLR